MKIEAVKIKLWCDANLSTVAWQRIIVKVSPQFRGSGLKLSSLLNPDHTVLLDDQQYAVIKQAVEETYDVSMAITV
ncbi:MAG: hypothetical protein RIF33_09390 [Cyclobacteriaceae bacterium]